jgi:hypothetical protein
VTAVRGPNGRNVRSVAGSREPIVDRRPDPAALDGWLAWPMMARDQQHQAVSARNSLIEASVDRCPRRIKVHAMQVDDAIRRSRPAAQLLVPASVESPFADWKGLRAADRRGALKGHSCYLLGNNSWRIFSGFRNQPFARKRPNGHRDPGPQFRLFRAERAHGRPHPWGRGSAPAPWPTCRRRLPPLQRPGPNRCRSDSAL